MTDKEAAKIMAQGLVEGRYTPIWDGYAHSPTDFVTDLMPAIQALKAAGYSIVKLGRVQLWHAPSHPKYSSFCPPECHGEVYDVLEGEVS